MKGWRTIAFNLLTALIALLGSLGVIEGSDAPDAGAINAFLDNIEGIMLFLNPIGNIALRWITTGPVGTKVDPSKGITR